MNSRKYFDNLQRKERSMDNSELTPRQIEMIEEVRAITKKLGRVPTLEMLGANPDWPGVGAIRYHFRSYTELLVLAGLPTPRNAKRYHTKSMMSDLKNYIFTLGRVPSQSEVRYCDFLPSDEIYLNLFPDWETVILEAGFTMSWCSPEKKQKMKDDLWRKYVELGYRLPAPQHIQNDPEMEKVFVYVQVFGDLRSAWTASGVWDDFCERKRQEITETILRLHKELGRAPKIRDPGMPDHKLIKKVFGSYPNALKAVGLAPNYQFYERKELILQLKRKYIALGRVPTTREIEQDPLMASMQTFRREFGSYDKALRAAKISRPKKAAKPEPEKAERAPKYSKAELISQLQKKGGELKRAPKQKEVESDPAMASVNTFENKFGSFAKALEAAGFEGVRKREYSDSELLESLRRKYIEVGFPRTGKRPTNKEINADPKMASTRAYDVHFGTTGQARKLVERMLRKGKTAEAVLTEWKSLTVV